MSEKKYFVLSIDTDECFDAINTAKGDRLVFILKQSNGFVGVHVPDDGSKVLMLFETNESRSKVMSQLVINGWQNVHAEEKFAYADIDGLK